jgi:hypothetical protein
MIGLLIAGAFAGLTGAVYGVELLLYGTWPVLVLWGLIAAPAMMYAVSGDRRD